MLLLFDLILSEGHNNMRVELTDDLLNRALAGSVWDFGNQVLYDMCRNNPEHKADGIILGKIWLIGRSYSAAIERRRGTANADAESFYESDVAPKIRNSEIDRWFDGIRNGQSADLALHLEAHKRVLDLFTSISRLEQRSLASKYLHFHFPERFFIFDSRAQKAISRLTPPVGRKLPPLREHDYDYARFVLRCEALRQRLEERLARPLSPRDLDNILLSFKP